MAALTLSELVTDADERQEHIVEVLGDAFSDLIEADPRAFRRKFRKMAADPFAFYRGTPACSTTTSRGSRTRGRTSRAGRVWIQGDLHAENYGTYMDSAGILVFDVNDFDEAYLGHFTWDLQRMAASLALLGFGYAALRRHDRADDRQPTRRAYVEQVRAFATGDRDEEFRLTLETTDGLLQEFLQSARADTRLRPARLDDDARGPRAALLRRAGRAAARGRRARVGARGLPGATSRRSPRTKRQQSVSYDVKDVVGRQAASGSAAPACPPTTCWSRGARRRSTTTSCCPMKQGNIPAPSRVVDDAGCTSTSSTRATARRSRSGRCRPTPTRGSAGASSAATARSSRSSPRTRTTSTGARISEPDEIVPLLRYLGQATAKVHCVSDAASDQPLVDFEIEEALMEAIGDEDERFAADLAEFGAAYGELARDDHRRFVDAFRNGAIPGVGES